jgi:UDP-N-acetylglucosamine transferase subunit ALG13/SAM-dependent methyltransferase
MILVTTGTHEGQFDRLVRKVDEIASEIEEKIIIQIGYGKYIPKNAEFFRFKPTLNLLYKEARLIITQSATSLIEVALKYKKPVITVPRQVRYKEHINDHQVEFGVFFAKKTGIKCIINIEDLSKDLLKNYKVKANLERENLIKLRDFYSKFFIKLNQEKKYLGKNRLSCILNLIDPKKEDRILNIGISNIPEIEKIIEHKVKECITVDIDQKKIKYAKPYLNKAIILNRDITQKNIGFKEGYFDKIVMLEVLEHLKDDNGTLLNLNSLLKKEGLLILSVPNNNFLHYLHPVTYLQHERQYTKEKLILALEKAGFKIEFYNNVETWTLLPNLYLHLFFKFILRKQKKFLTFKKAANKSYAQKNKNGLNILIKAKKIN